MAHCDNPIDGEKNTDQKEYVWRKIKTQRFDRGGGFDTARQTIIYDYSESPYRADVTTYDFYGEVNSSGRLDLDLSGRTIFSFTEESESNETRSINYEYDENGNNTLMHSVLSSQNSDTTSDIWIISEYNDDNKLVSYRWYTGAHKELLKNAINIYYNEMGGVDSAFAFDINRHESMENRDYMRYQYDEGGKYISGQVNDYYLTYTYSSDKEYLIKKYHKGTDELYSLEYVKTDISGRTIYDSLITNYNLSEEETDISEIEYLNDQSDLIIMERNNSLITHYSYDSENREVVKYTLKNGVELSRYEHTYDDYGNLILETAYDDGELYWKNSYEYQRIEL